MNKVRFLLVGALVFVCDGAVFYGLISLGVKVEYARALALITAVQLTFIGHRVYVLDSPDNVSWRIAWCRHQLASSVGGFINYALFSWLFNLSHNQSLAFIMAILFTTAVNFALAAFWVHGSISR
ncbi:MAG: GtrA family protein [Pseudomonadota bacterium]|nr:GtrA family protein [Pseudomonadota bacterium]